MNLDSLLHPKILSHAYLKFLTGDLRNAVLDSLISVFDMIRERTGLDLDGKNLVDQAFSLENPRLILSELDTESGKNDQKGFIQILAGAYLGVRNPKAHSLHSDLTVESAAQYLVFASLLARRVSTAKLGNFLRFDGLYISPSGCGMGECCIRFCKDKKVLGISIGGGTSTNEINEVIDHLTEENALVRGYQIGSYIQENNTIKFSLKSPEGEIIYSGEIRGAELHLQSISMINNHSEQSVYTFKRKHL